MKAAFIPPRIFDLAAMRGWRTVRLDRLPCVHHEAAKPLEARAFEFKKAA